MMLRWIFREFRNNQRFTILFILNLSLGLAGFIALDSFKVSLKQVLEQNSKNFLSADLSVSARRKLIDAEVNQAETLMGPTFKKSHLWEFFSMVGTSSGTKLVQLKAIDQDYPFYGELILGSGRKIDHDSQKEIISEMSVWVYPELLIQLGLKVGDQIKLGESQYKIADTITLDSTQTFRLSSLAPKIYGGIEMIKKSGLVEKGTTFTDAILYKITDDKDPEKIAKEIFTKITDPGVQVTTGKAAAQDSGRALGYLSDYLGLVSLVALFLAGIGAAYLYRSFFSMQLKSVATLNALGLTSAKIRIFLLGQIFIMGIVAAAISALAGLVLFPFLRLLLQEFTPLQVPMSLNFRILGLALAMSTVGSLSISLPFLLQIGRLKGSQLFQEESSISIPWKINDFIILLVPMFFFWVLSVWEANSIKTGSLFFALLLACLFCLVLLNWVAFRFLGAILSRGNWKLKYIGLQLSRKSSKTLSCALALSLGALLINLLPQLKTTIKNDISSPDSSALPALFVFDIQDDQVDGVNQLFAQKNIHGLKPAPLVRARILQVNGLAFEKVTQAGKIQTREEETEAKFRNRGFNLSFREKLSSSENLVAGKLWDKPFDQQAHEMAQISVEEKFAERLKFQLGDVLTFDVQGVEIVGKITSFRSVKWNSFQPNFFVIFQPGVLDDAPKSFLVAVPKLDSVSLSQLQIDLVALYPNLSIVDVARTVEQIVGLAEKMSWSLELMAALCLIVGFLVLYSIISHQVLQSQWDLNLLKILGASAPTTLANLVIEYSLIGMVASIFGAGLSIGVATVLSRQVFESKLEINFVPLLLSAGAITALSALMAWLTARKVSQNRPQLILQS